MMKRLYALSKKCENRFGIRAEYLCLFLSIAIWLLIGMLAAFAFGEFCGLTHVRRVEMMRTLGPVSGVSIGYIYGMVWLMRHAV